MNNFNKQMTIETGIVKTIISKLVFISKGNKINLDIYNKEISNINSNIEDIEKEMFSLEKSIKSSIDNYSYTSKIIYNTAPNYVNEELLAKNRKNTLDKQIANINYQKELLMNKLKELEHKKEVLISYYNSDEFY